MTTYIFDSEWYSPEGSDIVTGVEKLHCVVFKEWKRDNIIAFTEETHNLHRGLKEMKEFLSQPEATYIGHNILNADLEVFRRLFGMPFTVGRDSINGVPCRFIDTYTLSKRLNPDRKPAYYKGKSVGVHGLKAWGVRTGMYKPEIENWKDLPLEVYLHRCKSDVLNNEATYELLLEEMR